MWSWKASVKNKHRGLLAAGGVGQSQVRSQEQGDEQAALSSECFEAAQFYHLPAKLFLLQGISCIRVSLTFS